MERIPGYLGLHSKTLSQKTNPGAAETAQQLRAYIAFAEDSRTSVPGTHVRWLTLHQTGL